MTILIVTKIWYKMECHRDKVVVRVTSIYDYLIGHGDTGVLLEGDSRLGYHVRHIISSISRPFRGYHAMSARYVRVSSVTWVCLCTHTQQGNDTPNVKGIMSSSNSSACFLIELNGISRWRTWHPEVSSGYKSFWSKDPELYYCSHVCILHK